MTAGLLQNNTLANYWGAAPTTAIYLGTAAEALDIYIQQAGSIRSGDMLVMELLSSDAARLIPMMRVLLSGGCPLRTDLQVDAAGRLPLPVPPGESWLNPAALGPRVNARDLVLNFWRGTSTPAIGVVTLDNVALGLVNATVGDAALAAIGAINAPGPFGPAPPVVYPVPANLLAAPNAISTAAVVECVNRLGDMLPDADGCASGFLLATSRVGFKAWRSSSDSGSTANEIRSCYSMTAFGQQGPISLGSGGREILALSRLYNLDEVRVQTRSLIDTIVDLILPGQNNWMQVFGSWMQLSKLLQSCFVQALRGTGIPFQGLFAGGAWSAAFGASDPRFALNEISGRSSLPYDGSDLGLVVGLISRETYGLQLPQGLLRALAWRNSAIVLPGANQQAGEFGLSPFEGLSRFFVPDCIHPADLFGVLTKQASRPGADKLPMANYDELAQCAAVPSAEEILIETVSRSETEAVSDSPRLVAPSLGLGAIAGILGFSAADMPNFVLRAYFRRVRPKGQSGSATSGEALVDLGAVAVRNWVYLSPRNDVFALHL